MQSFRINIKVPAGVSKGSAAWRVGNLFVLWQPWGCTFQITASCDCEPIKNLDRGTATVEQLYKDVPRWCQDDFSLSKKWQSELVSSMIHFSYQKYLFGCSFFPPWSRRNVPYVWIRKRQWEDSIAFSFSAGQAILTSHKTRHVQQQLGQ